MKIRKGSLVKYKDLTTTEPHNVGVVVSNPKEIQFKFSEKIYALKMAVDVLFDDKLYSNVLVERLELIKI